MNISYSWNFGDGLTGSDSTITHSYLSTGIYTAVVTASNTTNNLTATTVVTITDVPVAGLMAANDSPTSLGSTTTLTATLAAGTNINYTWNFGDSLTGNGAAITHVYPAVGTYTAVVTASNATNSLTATTVVTITDVPVAGLMAANDSPTSLGSTTTLTTSLTSGSNVSYTWSLGDGLIGSGAVITHVYPAVGTYTVVVTASNATNSLTATTVVTITDVPIEGLTAVNDSPTSLGSTTTLTANLIA
jgi:PKD repeat protein